MANSVPGQVSAGIIDGLFRDNPGDGTLGLPDYSRVPYTYAPLLGPTASSPQWVVTRRSNGAFGGLKGNPDGYGALRSTGGPRGAAQIEVLPQTTGSGQQALDASRHPDFTWGPQDFAFAVRHPGAASWTAASTRAYVVFTRATNSVGMRLTTSAAQGPWDAELADSAAVSLDGLINVWNGSAHTFTVGCFGQNVFVTIDDTITVPFRAPRAYKRNADGSTDLAVFSNLPSSGDYVGFDTRGAEAYLYGWTALQPPSGDFFYYDMGPLTVQTPPAGTYTPTTTATGETWIKSGTVTASKDGLLISTSGSATFNVDWPYGVVSTVWADTSGGFLFRWVDADNFYQVTTTGVFRSVGGTLTRFHTFATNLKIGDHVAVRNWPDSIRVFVNGVSVAYYSVGYHREGRGIGFRSGSSTSSQWRFITFQPLVSSPVLPTA
ncbi:hypothetical protein ACPCSE_29780 [Streptomyces cellulosae]